MGVSRFSRSVFCLTFACFLVNSVAVAQSGPMINVPPGDLDKFCVEHRLLEPLLELNPTSFFEPSYQMANSFISAKSIVYSKEASKKDLRKLGSKHMELLARLSEIENRESDLMTSASSPSCPSGQPANSCVVASCTYVNGVNCNVIDVSGLAKEKAQVIDQFLEVLNKQVSLAANTPNRKKEAKSILSALTDFKGNVMMRRQKVGIVYTCN